MEFLNEDADEPEEMNPLSEDLGQIQTLDVLKSEGFLANPVAHEAEALCLASILADGTASGATLDQIAPEDFDKYTELAGVMLGLATDGYTVDRETVEHLHEREIPPDVLDRDPPAENANRFAEKVHFVARKREAVQRLAILAMQAQNGHAPKELAELTEETAQKLSSSADTTEIRRLDHYLPEAQRRMEEEEETRVTGIPTHLDALNRITKGWQDGELTYVAGRPSMGKTSLCLGCAKHAAKDGHSVGYISAEQRPIPLSMRVIKQEARASLSTSPRNLSLGERRTMVDNAVETLEQIDLYLSEESGMDISDLKGMIRRMEAEKGCDLVFFDYFQLLQKPEGTYSRKNQWLGNASRNLKSLAKALNIPLVVAAQLNREVESRGGNKRPQLSDLREAGQMEEDADTVIFVYRAEQYGISRDNQGNSTEGKAELIVDKNRNRTTGTAHVAFIEPFTLFEDLASGVHDNVDLDNSGSLNRPSTGGSSTGGSPKGGGPSGRGSSGDGAPYDPGGADF